jgi:hypothetical protein
VVGVAEDKCGRLVDGICVRGGIGLPDVLTGMQSACRESTLQEELFDEIRAF